MFRGFAGFVLAAFPVLLLVLSGCGSEEGRLTILGSDRRIPVPSGTVAKRLPYQYPSPGREVYGVPREWIPPSQNEKTWRAIVVHHSATDNGNASLFDEWHRKNNGWQGVGYDFVIGNGSDSADGLTEVTFRWKQQIAGAHVGGTPDNWANEDAIGICLVGNFDRTKPTASQMQSLVRLIRFLQKRYAIPSSRVYGHRETPGYTGKTDCPGKRFSMSNLRKML